MEQFSNVTFLDPHTVLWENYLMKTRKLNVLRTFTLYLQMGDWVVLLGGGGTSSIFFAIVLSISRSSLLMTSLNILQCLEWPNANGLLYQPNATSSSYREPTAHQNRSSFSMCSSDPRVVWKSSLSTCRTLIFVTSEYDQCFSKF